jgi:carbonic anhydrase
LSNFSSGHLEDLIDVAVCANAAQTAFDLRQEVERAAKWEIEVLYDVCSLHNHQISMPVDPRVSVLSEIVNLTDAPTNPRQSHTLAVQIAEILKPKPEGPSGASESAGDGSSNGDANAPTKVDGLIFRRDD